MRMGPGKHLKGRKLFDGIVTPEEVSVESPHSHPGALNIPFYSLTISMNSS